MLDDLELVLTRNEYAKMQQEILNLIFSLMQDLDTEHAGSVVNSMGITDLDALLAPKR